jgi:hypothetical protein
MTRLEPNGVHSTEPSRSPEPGIYAPIITIFTNDKKQDLDLDAQAAHAVRYFPDATYRSFENRLIQLDLPELVLPDS